MGGGYHRVVTEGAPGPPQRAAVILAGGRSARFGSPKAAAILEGQPLLAWVVAAASKAAHELVVVGPQDEDGLAVSPGVRLVHDRETFAGPLAGAITGLNAVTSDVVLLLPCDAPLVRPALLAALAGALPGVDAVVPIVAGRRQPLLAAYRRGPVLGAFRAAYAAGERSLVGALAQVAVHEVPEPLVRDADPALLSFAGANTPAEFETLAALARRHRLTPPM